MEYYVAFFCENVSALPGGWINFEEKKVFWPTKNVQKNKMKDLEPDSTWKTYDLKKHLGPFPSLEEASNIEKFCLHVNTSDDSESILSAATNTNLRKREIKKPRFADESDNEDLSDQGEQEKVKRKQKKKIPIENASNSKASDEDLWNTNLLNGINMTQENEILEKSTDAKHKKQLPKGKPSITSVQKCTTRYTIVAGTGNNQETLDFQEPGTSRITEDHGSTSPLHHADDNQEESNNAVIHNFRMYSIDTGDHYRQPSRTVDSSNSQPLSEERYRTVHHCQILKKLNRLINSRPTQAADDTDEASHLPNLPIDSVEVLDNLEQLVTTSQPAKEQYVKLLKNIGGKNEGDCVRNAARYIMTDNLASQYCMTSQRNTRKFEDKNIFKILTTTISQVNASYSVNNCRNYFKTWIQHAKERLQAAQKKK